MAAILTGRQGRLWNEQASPRLTMYGFGLPYRSPVLRSPGGPPTPGSVMLAGMLLKMGGYGFLRVMLPSVGAAWAKIATVFLALAVINIIHGAAVAMAQPDFRRLVAFTSINHMGFVLLGATIAALDIPQADRLIAIDGSVLQRVAGGVFFLVGMLQKRTRTRQFSEFGGGWGKLPVYAVVLTTFALSHYSVLTSLTTMAHMEPYRRPSRQSRILRFYSIEMGGIFEITRVTISYGNGSGDEMR